eukprot:763129-Hanusia_phi.AAC.1
MPHHQERHARPLPAGGLRALVRGSGDPKVAGEASKRPVHQHRGGPGGQVGTQPYAEEGARRTAGLCAHAALGPYEGGGEGGGGDPAGGVERGEDEAEGQEGQGLQRPFAGLHRGWSGMYDDSILLARCRSDTRRRELQPASHGCPSPRCQPPGDAVRGLARADPRPPQPDLLRLSSKQGQRVCGQAVGERGEVEKRRVPETIEVPEDDQDGERRRRSLAGCQGDTTDQHGQQVQAASTSLGEREADEWGGGGAGQEPFADATASRSLHAATVHLRYEAFNRRTQELQGHGGWVRNILFARCRNRLQSLQSGTGGEEVRWISDDWDEEGGGGGGGGGVSLLFTGSNDATVRVWYHEEEEEEVKSVTSDLWQTMREESGRSIVLRGHRGAVLGLAVTGRRLLSSSCDGSIRVWGMTGGWDCVQVLEGHRGGVYDVMVHEGIVLSGSEEREIKVWGWV